MLLPRKNCKKYVLRIDTKQQHTLAVTYVNRFRAVWDISVRILNTRKTPTITTTKMKFVLALGHHVIVQLVSEGCLRQSLHTVSSLFYIFHMIRSCGELLFSVDGSFTPSDTENIKREPQVNCQGLSESLCIFMNLCKFKRREDHLQP